MNKFLSVGTLLILAVPIVSCGGTYKAYPGPERPIGEVAIVQIAKLSDQRASSVRIRGVDTETFLPTKSSVAILPGRHVLLTSAFGGFYFIVNRSACWIYFFETKAGEKYNVLDQSMVQSENRQRVITPIVISKYNFPNAMFTDPCNGAIESLKVKASEGDARAKAALELL